MLVRLQIALLALAAFLVIGALTFLNSLPSSTGAAILTVGIIVILFGGVFTLILGRQSPSKNNARNDQSGRHQRFATRLILAVAITLILMFGTVLAMSGRLFVN